MPLPPVSLVPIGRVESGRSEPVDDDWDRVSARIRLDGQVLGPDAAAGLDSFSHIEVVYHFHRAEPDKAERNARHPRGNPEWPRVGILAQRGKDRPNPIGLTICRLTRVDGLVLEVEGLDAIDGTAVLDIKPVMSEFLPRGAMREPQWSRELMRNYWRAERR